MDSGPAAVVFLLVLILGNGFLALSEIAIVSARKALLQSRAEAGSKGDQIALDLAKSPGKFLSTIQIGITLVGIMTGAIGEATIAADLEKWLTSIGVSAGTSELIGVGLVVITITYLSLILGELAPKQIGLTNAERVAAAVAPVIKALAWITQPLVWLLTHSTAFVLRILRIHPSDEPTVTEEEVKILIDQGTAMGVFEKEEDAIVDQVFKMGDQKTLSVTIPRGEIVWLDLDDPVAENYDKMRKCRYSHFPVAEGDLDNLQGYVSSKDLLSQFLAGNQIDIRSVIRPPVYIAENSPLFEALKHFRTSGDEIAFVIDEYGGVQGLITLQDILNELVEDLPGKDERYRPQAIPRTDGSWLIDGSLSIEDFREIFSLDELPGEEEKVYLTLGGYIMSALGQVPQEGAQMDLENLRIEVIDMDRHRVDKVLVTIKQGQAGSPSQNVIP